MITIKLNDKEYKIKNEWSEFTFKEYAAILSAEGLPLSDRLHAYTGIPKDLIHKLDLAQVAFICDALALLDEPDNIFLFTKEHIQEFNVGQREYGDLENALKFIRKSKNPVIVFDKLIKIFIDDYEVIKEIREIIDITPEARKELIREQGKKESSATNLNAIEVLPKGVFFLTCINKFLEEFKRLQDYTPSVEEEEAGVDDLQKFGSFGTAVQLARKYGKTHDEILAMPAREVYTTLLYDFEQSEVEKRLNQIRSRKK